MDIVALAAGRRRRRRPVRAGGRGPLALLGVGDGRVGEHRDAADPAGPLPAGGDVNIDLPDEALEFGIQAARALEAAGGDDWVERAERDPAARDALVAPTLEQLGAWDLDPRREHRGAGGRRRAVPQRRLLGGPVPGGRAAGRSDGPGPRRAPGRRRAADPPRPVDGRRTCAGPRPRSTAPRRGRPPGRRPRRPASRPSSCRSISNRSTTSRPPTWRAPWSCRAGPCSGCSTGPSSSPAPTSWTASSSARLSRRVPGRSSSS